MIAAAIRTLVAVPLFSMVAACSVQSGSTGMKPPKDPSAARLRAEAFDLLPRCESDLTCHQLMTEAGKWALTQTDYAVYSSTSNRIVLVKNMGTTGAFIRVDVGDDAKSKYLRLAYECYEYDEVCRNADAYRLSLYQFVQDRLENDKTKNP